MITKTMTSLAIAPMLVFVLGFPALAPSAEPGDIGQATHTLDEALTDHAQSLGITRSELDALMRWQNEFALAVTAIKTDHPEALTGATLVGDAPRVGFKAAAPPDAVAALRALSPDVTIIEDIGWSEDEISAYGEKLHYAVYEAVGHDVSTGIDALKGTIDVVVPSSRLSTAKQAVDTIAIGARSTDKRFAVSVQGDPSYTSGEDDIYGGYTLSSCTAGWSVSRTASGYPNGIMTAGHCGNTQTASGTTLTFRTESSTRDVQWHSSTATAAPSFWSGSGNNVLSPVTSWANPVEGQSLCKYGKNTHYTCDVTFKDNECRDNYCDMMTMQHRYAASGDSGGPWFAGNTAYGVHSGYKTLSSSLRDMFTPVSTAFGALEVNLKMT